MIRPGDAVRVVVLAGGDAPDPGVLAVAAGGALVIAADSGMRHARAAGITVDVLVGDLDSIDPGDLAAAETGPTTVETHPADKDETDLELAVRAALAHGVTDLTVVGIDGGRVDHFLANVLLLSSPELAGVTVRAHAGRQTVHVVRGGATGPSVAAIRGAPGDVVTLLPVGGPARGVRTDGLRWPLTGDDLDPGTTRGVSNELTGTVAHVTLDHGVLLAVTPGGPS